MKVVIKPIQDYAPRLFIYDNKLICSFRISTIIEKYAEKLGLDPLNLDLYTKCYKYLQQLDIKYSNKQKIYYCEDKFHIDIIPFLDNILLENAKL